MMEHGRPIKIIGDIKKSKKSIIYKRSNSCQLDNCDVSNYQFCPNLKFKMFVIRNLCFNVVLSLSILNSDANSD